MLTTNRIVTYLPHALWLSGVIVLEGFVTIAIEVLTLRQLSPFFGTSVVTSSCIIGFFLFFLACGYYKGGLVHSDYQKKLSKNFLIIAILFSIGLSYPFITLFYIFTSRYITSILLLQLTFYLLIIIGPITYLLGQTLPITTHFFRHNKINIINSQVLALSTLGSFSGALITSLILMPYLGIANTLLCVYCCIGLLLILMSLNDSLLETIFYYLLAGIILFIVNVIYEKTQFIQTNAYANYAIISKGSTENTKLLSINGNSSSSINRHNKGNPYIETMKKILFKDLKLRNKDILVLGAGGFTLSAKSTYQNHFDYVDIDPSIKSIVTPSFISKINGNFIAGDAYTFLKNNKKQYNVIISDTYKARANIPEHLITQQYFSQIKHSLKKNGFALFNIIANPTFSDTYSATVNNTLHSIFHSCVVIPIHAYQNTFTNILYLCKNNQHHSMSIYTQNKNKAALDYFHSIS